MPNLIKPSQLKKNLPEETDTVAKALLKYLKFTITFWRWFQGVVKSNGDLTDEFKQQLCGVGCGGKDINPNEEEVGPDPGDNDKPPSTPPSSGEPGCCVNAFNKGNDTFKHFNVSSTANNNNNPELIDLKCINNIRYALVKNPNSAVNFSPNNTLTTALENLPIILSEKPSVDSGDQLFLDPSGNKIYYPEHIGGGVSTELMWNQWPHAEILIWGQTPKLIDEFGYSTHHLIGEVTLCGKKAQFLMKNNDFWMARIIFTDLIGAFKKDSANPYDDYFFSDFDLNLRVTNSGGLIERTEGGDQIKQRERGESSRFFKPTVKVGGRTIKQSVLTKICGIRVSAFNLTAAERMGFLREEYLEGDNTPLPYGLGYGSGNNWNSVLTVFDERWLNEEPLGCYQHHGLGVMGAEQLQMLWENKNTNEKPFYPNSVKDWVIDRGKIFFDNYSKKS